MDIGRSNQLFADARAAIHLPSCQAYPARSWTIDAERGGISHENANGSALPRTWPVWVRTSNLYRSPTSRSGTKISHTPLGSRLRITWTRPSHPLKSPTTLTRCAFGAH